MGSNPVLGTTAPLKQHTKLCGYDETEYIAVYKTVADWHASSNLATCNTKLCGYGGMAYTEVLKTSADRLASSNLATRTMVSQRMCA